MKTVLFVCTHNAGRSQMAAAFFNALAPSDLRAQSAGSQPRHAVWPVVAEAMDEVGIELGRARPQRLTREMQLHADLAVTMGCGDACPFVATRVEAWDLPDPADLPLDRVRLIRDEIRDHVVGLLARADEIREDRTAHQMRLTQLLRLLEGECDRSDREVRDCADAILQRYDDAPVRSFTITLAYRDARQCLRADHCDALVPA